MQHFRTVLGDVCEEDLGVCLPHEHLLGYSEYLYGMARTEYLDKERVLHLAVGLFRRLKQKYGLGTFVDCSPVNIGRDVDMMKAVSEQTGVNIICSTGFYYTEEPLLYYFDIERIVQCIIVDANKVNAGIIKCAVEKEMISAFDEKLLRACARAQRTLHLPLVMHTNAVCKNGIRALEILLEEGVEPCAVTVAHLSDTDDVDYIEKIAQKGCFIGLDRMYGDTSEAYISKEVNKILALCERGYADKLLLSHDALFFNGFEAVPKIVEKPRFAYCFEHILPRLPKDIARKITNENPVKMLKCVGE